MAIHAAMVDRMDREIGRVLAQLRTMDALDEHADFLPVGQRCQRRDHGAGRRSRPGRGCRVRPARISAWGLAGRPSRTRRFAATRLGCTRGAFRLRSSSTGRDGIPGARRAEARRRPRDRHRADDPGRGRESTAANRIVLPLTRAAGPELVPAFARDGAFKHDEIWWQHEGNRAIRVGDWKLVAAGKDGPWELYDLATDRTETHDLAAELPEKVRELRGDGRCGGRVCRPAREARSVQATPTCSGSTASGIESAGGGPVAPIGNSLDATADFSSFRRQAR